MPFFRSKTFLRSFKNNKMSDIKWLRPRFFLKITRTFLWNYLDRKQFGKSKPLVAFWSKSEEIFVHNWQKGKEIFVNDMTFAVWILWKKSFWEADACFPLLQTVALCLFECLWSSNIGSTTLGWIQETLFTNWFQYFLG